MNSAQRITNLDFIRGIALMGILVMNVISFGLPDSAYMNHLSYGVENLLDWIVVVISTVFFDSKMMGLFSALFGAGMVIFYERAKDKTTKPLMLSIWRNTLLLFFGIAHFFLWEGDILTVYAVCSIFIILTQIVKIKNTKILSAITTFIFSGLLYVTQSVNSLYDDNGFLIGEGFWIELFSKGGSKSFGKLWFPETEGIGNIIAIWVLADGFIRALALIIFGMLLYRLNIFQGTKNILFYKKFLYYGFGIGIPFAAYGSYLLISGNYAASTFLPSRFFNTISIIPMVCGYIGLLTILNSRNNLFAQRIRACGKMAFTNYILQTVLSLLVLDLVFTKGQFTRSELILYVITIIFLQYFWSKRILDLFRFGPLEWFWRKLTYIFIK
jgi:uncharacterized protein